MKNALKKSDRSSVAGPPSLQEKRDMIEALRRAAARLGKEENNDNNAHHK